MLTLAEEIFILSSLEKKESVRLPSSPSLPFALAGAALMELVLSGAARVDGGRLFLTVNSERSENDPSKSVILKIQKAGKAQKLNHWVFVLGSRGNHLSKSILASLIDKEILVENEQSYDRKVSNCAEAPRSHTTKFLLKRQLRDAMFCDGKADEHFVALLVLMESSGMLNHLFTTDELFWARKQIKGLRKDVRFGKQTIELYASILTAMEYAIAASVSA